MLGKSTDSHILRVSFDFAFYKHVNIAKHRATVIVSSEKGHRVIEFFRLRMTLETNTILLLLPG